MGPPAAPRLEMLPSLLNAPETISHVNSVKGGWTLHRSEMPRMASEERNMESIETYSAPQWSTSHFDFSLSVLCCFSRKYMRQGYRCNAQGHTWRSSNGFARRKRQLQAKDRDKSQHKAWWKVWCDMFIGIGILRLIWWCYYMPAFVPFRERPEESHRNSCLSSSRSRAGWGYNGASLARTYQRNDPVLFYLNRILFFYYRKLF